jgi:hypothetical protein
MKNLSTKTLLAGIVVFASLGVNAELIATEDFEGVVSGWVDNSWNNNTTTIFDGSTVLGGYEEYGTGAYAEKVFDLSGIQTEVFIDLDFIKGDSWDSGESYYISIDGNLIHSQSIATMRGGTQLGGRTDKNWVELVVPVSLSYQTTGQEMTFKIWTNLNSGGHDEWFAIDNVVINDNTVLSTTLNNTVAVPLPASVALLLLAMVGFSVRRKTK